MEVEDKIGCKALIGKAGALLLTRRSGTIRRAGGGQRFENSIKLIGGLFQTDKNRDFLSNAGMLLSRWTWESPQTIAGLGFSHLLNALGITDKVEYWGGATFSTTRNRSIAVSIGNYINVRTQPYTDFDAYILNDQDVMHEYGHTFDSRIWGPSYLIAIGAPSLLSANKANKTGNSAYHREKWYERSASRKAKNYFSKYGVIWNDASNPTW